LSPISDLYELLVTLDNAELVEFGGDYKLDRSGQLKTEGGRLISRGVCYMLQLVYQLHQKLLEIANSGEFAAHPVNIGLPI
jgi:hypothetical protein